MNPTRIAGTPVAARLPPAEVAARGIGTAARAGPAPERGAVGAGIAASVVVIEVTRGRGRGRQSVGVGAEVVRHGVRSSRSRR